MTKGMDKVKVHPITPPPRARLQTQNQNQNQTENQTQTKKKLQQPSRVSCPPAVRVTDLNPNQPLLPPSPGWDKTKTKHTSLDQHQVPSLSTNQHKRPSTTSSKKLSLSKAPTPEAIAGLSQELDDIERSLNGVDLEMFQDTTDSIAQGGAFTASLHSHSHPQSYSPSHSHTKLTRKTSVARHLMRENSRLLKKVDRLEYELSQSKARLKFGSSMELATSPLPELDSTREENVPLVVTALKAKLTESEEIIAKQCRQLEAQDERVLELEKRVRILTDSFLLDTTRSHPLLPRSHWTPSSVTSSVNRGSILMIDDRPTSFLASQGLPPNNFDEGIMRGFVSDLFHRDNIGGDSLPRSQPSPISFSSSSREPIPLSLYATGILTEPIPPVLPPVLPPSIPSTTTTPLTHSRQSSLNQVLRSISISSLAKDTLPTPSKLRHSPSTPHVTPTTPSKLRHAPSASHVIPTPKETILVNSLQSTVQSLELALQDAYSQHTSLHTSLAQLQSRLEATDLTLARQRETHRQQLETLMDQIERSKLEAASYQRQGQDVARQNYSLTTQLEEALAKLTTLEGKRSKFFCF